METFPQLEEVYGFTPEELALNREGILSERQQKTIQKGYQRSNIIIFSAFIVHIIWVAIAIIGLENALGKDAIPIIVMIMTAVLLTWRYMFPHLRRYFQYQWNWKSEKIRVAKGVHPTDFEEREIRSGKSYMIDVESGTIDLNEIQFVALGKSKSYEIYYLPHDGKSIYLLSIGIE